MREKRKQKLMHRKWKWVRILNGIFIEDDYSFLLRFCSRWHGAEFEFNSLEIAVYTNFLSQITYLPVFSMFSFPLNSITHKYIE